MDTINRKIALKIKIKSLAAEAKIIKKEEKKSRTPDQRSFLQTHRLDVVRWECRHTHLAYAYLRGRRYDQVESKAKKPIDFQKLHTMINKYRQDPYVRSYEITLATIKSWAKA
jgi:hypothetical protein